MIILYAADATDFTTNGLCPLTPSSCKVREVLNGEYEVTLVHPIDEQGKWSYLVEGCIIRVPVPLASTPYIDLPDNVIKVDSSTRGVWRLTNSTLVRCAPGTHREAIARGTAGSRAAVIGTKYLSIYTYTATGNKRYEVSDTYPTSPVPTGQTRVIEIWYMVNITDYTSGKTLTGYVPGYSCSNVYYSDSIETVVGDVIESKQLRDQPFRIYKVTKQLNSVTVYARHIFYDLLDNIIISYTPTADDRGAEALDGTLAACNNADHGFDGHSDITEKNDEYSVTLKNPVEALMGDEGFIEKYGGELMRDWFDVYIVNRVGQDTNILIQEGKNLLGVKYDIDATDAVSRIVPIGKDSKGKDMYLPEVYIESEYASTFPHPKYGTLEVEDAKVGSGTTQAQAYQKMRDAAAQAFEDGADTPVVSLSVDFINVYDTEEYKQYTWLQNIYLGDAVMVKVKSLGLSVSMRMTQYEYDCLLYKYTSMTLGSTTDTIASSTISASQIPTGLITGGKIAQDAVRGYQIGNGSVDSLQIANGAIVAAKIGAAAIESAHIGTGVIQTAHIENGAITNAKITDGTIETAKIHDAAISTAKIADAAITNAKIGSAAVKEANIDNAAVTSAKIGQGAIVRAKIADAAIGTAQIDDAAITAAKIVSINADVISTGTLAAERLLIKGEGGLIYEINEQCSGLTPTQITDEKYEEYLDGSVLVKKSITADQIQAQTITAAEIKAGTITADRVQSGFGAALDLTGNSIYASVNAAADAAQSAVDAIENDVEPVLGDISRWMSFSSDGLRQGKEDSDYSTLIDNMGYHIDKVGVLGHVGSFTGNGMETPGITIGEIRCKATSTGGWVWVEV
ncbi:MAG: phage tail protein [Lachnospiraceae bacterium]|nr:phage tail protein [Lachnospiraceae bacterium]